MLLSEEPAVGAVGVPVNAGDASGAAPSIVIVWLTVKSTGWAEPDVLLPLSVLPFIWARYVLVTPLLLRPIVPVVVMVPPESGACAVIDVNVPLLALRLAICCAVALDETPF